MKGRKPKQDAVRRGLSDAYAMSAPDERGGVAMPADIAADPLQADIWAWIAPPSNSFTDQDLPVLRLLVQWHVVAMQAQTEMDAGGKVDIYNIDAMRALKNASGEIRSLSDMLGLSPLARSRIGLLNATTVKTAADTAAMFKSIDAAYALEDGDA